jgi:hypothetical protein
MAGGWWQSCGKGSFLLIPIEPFKAQGCWQAYEKEPSSSSKMDSHLVCIDGEIQLLCCH